MQLGVLPEEEASLPATMKIHWEYWPRLGAARANGSDRDSLIRQESAKAAMSLRLMRYGYLTSYRTGEAVTAASQQT